jgi:hypothetical protein
MASTDLEQQLQHFPPPSATLQEFVSRAIKQHIFALRVRIVSRQINHADPAPAEEQLPPLEGWKLYLITSLLVVCAVVLSPILLIIYYIRRRLGYQHDQYLDPYWVV